MIKNNAQKAGMNITDYMVSCAKKHKIIIVEDLKPLCHELHKIGTNINQLLLLSHQGRITCIQLTELSEAVKSLWQPLYILTEKVRRK